MPRRPRTHRAPRRQEPPPAQRVSACRLGYDRAWQARRLRILRRDHYLCQKCGAPAGKSAPVDHKIPKSQGGTDDDGNLQTLCIRCHGRKTVREDGGFGRA